MKTKVLLTIQGTQHYQEQEPETIELVTEGEMESIREGCWDISYAESALTGLEGVYTTFRVEPEQVTLTRIGKLNSQMVFRQGVPHNSLYRMEFGTLMLTVCATAVFYDITPEGGVIDLSYTIDIEKTTAGSIRYHLDIRKIP